MPPSGVLLLAGACLLVAAFCGVVVLREIEARQRLSGRIERVVRPHNRRRSLHPIDLHRPSARQRSGPIVWLAWGFGFDPAHLERYKLPWWLVILAACVLARLVMPAATAMLGKPGLVVPLAIAFGGPRLYFGTVDTRRRNQLLVQFPDALATLVRAVRIGIPVADAVQTVAREGQAPTAREFAAVHAEMLIGAPLDAALRAMAQRAGLPEYRFFASAVSLQAQVGGGLSDVLDNLADIIRRRVALRARGKALSAEARASAVMLSVMPILTGAMMWVINPGYIDTLFDDPKGRTMLGIAAVSLAIGVLSMRAIIRKTLA